jgi:hypothetical protein
MFPIFSRKAVETRKILNCRKFQKDVPSHSKSLYELSGFQKNDIRFANAVQCVEIGRSLFSVHQVGKVPLFESLSRITCLLGSCSRN